LVTVTDPQFGSQDNSAAEPSPSRTGDVTSLVTLANAMFAGVAGTFAATRSVLVTFLAAVLVALLSLAVVVRKRRHDRM
jgi:hypothetical protein